MYLAAIDECNEQLSRKVTECAELLDVIELLSKHATQCRELLEVLELLSRELSN